MELPIKTIVIIILSVLVLAILVSVFLMFGGEQISKTEADKIFTTGCLSLCNQEDKFELVIRLDRGDYPDFMRACQILYEKGPGGCLQECKCGVEVDPCERLCFNSKSFLRIEPLSVCNEIIELYPECNTCEEVLKLC